jgi:hypothetical protein
MGNSSQKIYSETAYLYATEDVPIAPRKLSKNMRRQAILNGQASPFLQLYERIGFELNKHGQILDTAKNRDLLMLHVSFYEKDPVFWDDMTPELKSFYNANLRSFWDSFSA